MAPETEATALAPASAAGRASAAYWAPQKRLTVWRRTICSPPARLEGDPVDLKEDDARHQDSAVMQVRKYIQFLHQVFWQNTLVRSASLTKLCLSKSTEEF